MKIKRETQIEKAVSKDETRFSIQVMELVKEKDQAYLIATTGAMLAKVPVELEKGDKLGKVSVDALRAARQITSKYDDISLRLNGKQVLTDGRTYPRPNEKSNGVFPDYLAVFPTKKPKTSIRLNARLLLDLALALGDECVTIGIVDDPKDLKPFVIKGKDGATGLLMPSKE